MLSSVYTLVLYISRNRAIFKAFEVISVISADNGPGQSFNNVFCRNPVIDQRINIEWF